MAGFSIENIMGSGAGVLTLVLLVAVIACVIIMIIMGVRMGRMQRRFRIFMEGKDGRSLEKTLMRKLDEIYRIGEDCERVKEQTQLLIDRLDDSFQKAGMVKYDAFGEMGGKLSFSLALLNRRDDGFILNAMHSREGCYTYVKEVIGGNPVVLLAEEEREALEAALSRK